MNAVIEDILQREEMRGMTAEGRRRDVEQQLEESGCATVWVKAGDIRWKLVKVDAEGMPIEPERAPANFLYLKTDPCRFDGGTWRYRPTFNEHGSVRDGDFIPDLKCLQAEKDGIFPYVPGKGPAPFTSESKKKAYQSRYGFTELGFEDLHREMKE